MIVRYYEVSPFISSVKTSFKEYKKYCKKMEKLSKKCEKLRNKEAKFYLNLMKRVGLL